MALHNPPGQQPAQQFQQPQYPPRQQRQFSPVALGPSMDFHCTDDAQQQYDVHGDVLPPAMAFVLGDQWLTGLCDCTEDTDSCIDTTFCPYCQLGYQYHRTRRNYVDMDAVMCLGACCGDVIVGGLGCSIATALLRHRIIQRYRIDEPVGVLLLKGLCCAPVSVCQVHREMKLRGEAPGGVCITTTRMPPPPPAMPAMGARGREAMPRSVFNEQGHQRHMSGSTMSLAADTTLAAAHQPPVNPYYVVNNNQARHSPTTTATTTTTNNNTNSHQHNASGGSVSYFDAVGYQAVAQGGMSSPGTPAAATYPTVQGTPVYPVQGTPVYPMTPLSIPDTPQTAGATATAAAANHHTSSAATS